MADKSFTKHKGRQFVASFRYLVNMCLCILAGQREAILPHSDQLPGSQQSDGGRLHAVHPGQPHSE